MKQKSIIKVLILSLFVLTSATAYADDDIQVYFTTEELPDLIKCLPAPPDTTSEHFVHDIMRYIWGKQQRIDPERAAMARRDAVWSHDSLFAEMSVPFGLKISKAETPEIWKLLEASLRTTDQMRVAPKRYYMRKRPFVRFNEHILTYGAEENEAELAAEGSYPSGHTARGWTTALLLAEINPANADAIFARGWQYCESRVIVGAHWQSDVDITRVAASIGYSRLQTSPAFRTQMAKAQAEFRKLTSKSKNMTSVDPNDSSGFVALTDAVLDAILDIRYFSDYNFVGTRVDGYETPVALLTREAAEALKAAADEFRTKGYRLKIYDTYRPQRAVDHFVRWAADLADTKMKYAFYPNVEKRDLFKKGYIAKKSSHTRGSTVDLTLIDATGNDIDMGTTYDWFGIESHPDFCGNPETGKYKAQKSTDGNSITEKQFANRMILRDVMLRHGFKPIEEEWWHFTLGNEPYPKTYFNFPIKSTKK